MTYRDSEIGKVYARWQCHATKASGNCSSCKASWTETCLLECGVEIYMRVYMSVKWTRNTTTLVKFKRSTGETYWDAAWAPAKKWPFKDSVPGVKILRYLRLGTLNLSGFLVPCGRRKEFFCNKIIDEFWASVRSLKRRIANARIRSSLRRQHDADTSAQTLWFRLK